MQFTRDTMTSGKMVGSLSTLVDAPLIDKENNVSLENFQSMDEEDEPILPPQVETVPSSSKKTTNMTANSNFARPHCAKSAIATKHQLEKEMFEIEIQKLNAFLSIQKNALLQIELRGKIQIEMMNSYRMNQQLKVPTLQLFKQNQTQPKNYSSLYKPSNNLVSPSLSDDYLQSGYSSSSSQ